MCALIAQSPFLMGQTAQTDSGGGNQTIVLEEFVTTGSNIPMSVGQAGLPLTTITADDIELLPVTTTSELLRTVPQVVGSGNYKGEQVGNPGGGESSVALRGLSASQTLVLINGRRTAAQSGISSGIGNWVNINTIPLAAIETVEVLRDGASSIYGADAVAGVVNIRLKERFEGARVSLQYGDTTQTGSIAEKIGTFVTGISNNNGRILFSGSYQERDGIYSRERELTRSANLAAMGFPTINWQSSAPNPSRVSVNGGPPLRLSPEVIRSGTNYSSNPDDYVPWTGTAFPMDGNPDDIYLYDRYDYRLVTTEALPQKIYSIHGDGEYTLADGFKAYAMGWYSRIRSEVVSAPTPLFSSDEPLALDASGTLTTMTISADNVWNPFGEEITEVRRRFIELGPRDTTTNVDHFHFNAGIRGTDLFDAVNFDAYMVFSRDETSGTNRNLINKQELYRQLQNNDPSVPSVNMFATADFNLSPAIQPALERIRLTTNNAQIADLSVLGVSLNSTALALPTGPLGLAGGVEFRRENLSFNADSNSNAFNTIGSTNSASFSGDRQVSSYYGEFRAPIISNKQSIPYARSLTLRGSARHERYSDFGNITVPSVSLIYEPMENFEFRASYQEAFEAPAVGNLFQTGSESFEDITNPFSDTSATAASQIQARTLRIGNPDLEAAESQGWSVGFSSTLVEGLRVSADWWRVSTENEITLYKAPFILEQAVLEGLTPTNNPGGTFSRRVTVRPDGYITNINIPYTNAGAVEVQGIDYQVSYSWRTENWGRFLASLDALYVVKHRTQLEDGGPWYESAGRYNDIVGQIIPRNRGSISIVWDYRDYSVSLRYSYIDSLKESALLEDGDLKIPSYSTVDLQASMELPWKSRLTVGVQNLLDEEVPWIANTYSNAWAPAAYDITGRKLYVRISKDF